MPSFNPLPSLYGRMTATEAAAFNYKGLSYQDIFNATGMFERMSNATPTPMLGRHPIRGLTPSYTTYDDVEPKPERSLNMACEMCNESHQETATQEEVGVVKYVNISLSTGGDNVVKESFSVCEACYLKVKAKITQLRRDVLTLSECEHTE